MPGRRATRSRSSAVASRPTGSSPPRTRLASSRNSRRRSTRLPTAPLPLRTPRSRRLARMSTLTEALPAAGEATTVEMTYREAITAALDDALAADPAVLLMGEDVDADGGVFKTNNGLVEKYGRQRIRSTPICENGFVGVALGMSLVGLRPVVEIMFADFLPTAGDAIVKQLPKYRFMSGGQCVVLVTLRVISGDTGRFGTQRSSKFESWCGHLPGLRVAT